MHIFIYLFSDVVLRTEMNFFKKYNLVSSLRSFQPFEAFILDYQTSKHDDGTVGPN